MSRPSVAGRTIAIVPVKELATAKSRLANFLTPRERIALVERLLGHVLHVLLDSPGISQVVVVSPDPIVLDRASRAGVSTLDESLLAPPQFSFPGGDQICRFPERPAHASALGHNGVLELARRHVAAWQPARLLVVSADLPLLQPHQLGVMLALAADEPVVVIAPDRHQLGTNALVLRPPGVIPFRFGPTSLADHRREATTRGATVRLFQSPGTAFDVDRPEDIDACLTVSLDRIEEGEETEDRRRPKIGLPSASSDSPPESYP